MVSPVFCPILHVESVAEFRESKFDSFSFLVLFRVNVSVQCNTI